MKSNPFWRLGCNSAACSKSISHVSFYRLCLFTALQVACALLLAGETSEAKFEAAKEILVQMGTYFQVQVYPLVLTPSKYQDFVLIPIRWLTLQNPWLLQDDYLDCYGAPEVIGKVLDWSS